MLRPGTGLSETEEIVHKQCQQRIEGSLLALAHESYLGVHHSSFMMREIKPTKGYISGTKLQQCECWLCYQHVEFCLTLSNDLIKVSRILLEASGLGLPTRLSLVFAKLTDCNRLHLVQIKMSSRFPFHWESAVLIDSSLLYNSAVSKWT